MCTSLFPHSLLCWYEVGMLKVSETEVKLVMHTSMFMYQVGPRAMENILQIDE